MAPWLVSLVQSPPPGFTFVEAPAARSFVRRPFCLLAPERSAAAALLAPVLDRILGVVVVLGEAPEPGPGPLGPYCRLVHVPSALRPHLSDFVAPQLVLLEAVRERDDLNSAQRQEMERQQRDRVYLNSQHLEFRERLLQENAERRRAVEETGRANEIYRSIFRAALSHAIIGTGPDGVINVFSEGAERLLGYGASEVVGVLTPLSFHLEAEVVACATGLGVEPGFGVFREISQRADLRTREWTYVRKDGTRFPVTLSCAARHDVQGRTLGYLGVASDISEQKAAETEVLRLNRELEQRVRERTAALTHSNAIIQATFESTAEGVVAVDLQGRITCCNERFLELCHVGPDVTTLEALHRAVLAPQLDRPEDFERIEREDAAHPDRSGLDVLEFKDGRVLERSSRLQREGEKIVGRVYSYRDITERRALESQLRHAQKLQAVGQLAAGVAHEINTPAQFVSDSLSFLVDCFRDELGLVEHYRRALAALSEAPGHEAVASAARAAEQAADQAFIEQNVPGSLDRALDGIERIATIVRAMKEFAHPDRREKSPTDLNHALEVTLTIARNEYKYIADVDLALGELPNVMCHAGDVNQAFLKLIVNAAHAIADDVNGTSRRGRIRIETKADGDEVVISVSDTGTGIPEAIRDRVFEPFFTTKEVGRGSGQGLAIARSVVVDKHGGSITFDSQVGRGTTFYVRLPIGGERLTGAEAAGAPRRLAS